MCNQRRGPSRNDSSLPHLKAYPEGARSTLTSISRATIAVTAAAKWRTRESLVVIVIITRPIVTRAKSRS